MHLPSLQRLRAPAALLALAICLPLAGCEVDTSTPEAIWGQQGLSPGRLQKPRAMAIDGHDLLYIVDMTARIQVFTTEGKYLRGWQTPEHDKGRPTGLSIGRNGDVLVADTHYNRVLVYSSEGQLLRTKGGTLGHAPDEFGLVTDAIEDSQGNFYVSEYGEFDRIQKFDHDWKYLLEWGSHGPEPGQFARPQRMTIDAEDHLWVVDACNNRIQIFDTSGKLIRLWGRQGSQPGEMYYPYDLALDGQGHAYICEFGNSRVQKFTLDGESLGCWGGRGRGPGQFNNPWSMVRDSRGKLFVLDTNNHRVQRISF